jgi:hypothetical protein
MVELGVPTVSVHGSFLVAMDEFRAEGRGADGDATELGRQIRAFEPSWRSAEGFAAYVRWLIDQAREAWASRAPW